MAARFERQGSFSGQEMTVISCIQLVIVVISSLFANNLLSKVSFISSAPLAFKIFSLVYSVLVFVVMLSKSKAKWTLMQWIKIPVMVVGFAMLFHIIAVLFGAPFFVQTEETFAWALLMSVLCILPLCTMLGAELEVLYRICVSNWSEYTVESYFQQCILFTVLGAWVGAFVIPLDWDRPWQVWPIPCAVGGLLGHTLGLITSGIGFYASDTRQEQRKFL